MIPPKNLERTFIGSSKDNIYSILIIFNKSMLNMIK